MLKRDKDQVRLDKYFNRKLFIRPFVCEKCGNEFWFEHGLVSDDVIELGKRDDTRFKEKDVYHYYLYPQNSYSYKPSKFCDICSREIQYIFDNAPDNEEALFDLADWIDGKSVEEL